MEKKDANKKYYTIDILHVVKSLWKNIWLILLIGAMAATAGFSCAEFLVDDTYSSTILLYVNNKSISIGSTGFNISASEITAAQSLVKTYGVILNNRTTLERVNDMVKDEVTYKYDAEKLSKMIEAGSVNGTEVMYVTVTAKDPYDAAYIANCIAEVLPIRIGEEIIEGASMKVVDYAVPDETPVGPSTVKYTAIGLALGLAASILVVAIAAMLDDRIHDEDYIIQNYDYPILAKIPNLNNLESKKYGYYSENKPKSGSDSKGDK